ncbi:MULTISPECIES: helix-turn-helix transcriptional regulator [unclassified Coleofasciculus]|uniref:helix-turn-helix transcriptional regulator n=1 Tax=unclassified Coleofasciculus TaxID=2692782 RepID=UPI00187DFCDF|nr:MULTISPECIES: helix-turn-helix transcriptional regulator [unclassified Coleofasciculus]MBE9125604.1 helix-turn-helix transcriptional regulator [Coleofasciculus sp. LEGE 07081]MBE9147318.1 helix-turn-helix transcriptional regulator [Coleofasciculus sp. LEGE 07092]
MVDHSREESNYKVRSLKELRERLGLTQAELAEKLGMARETVTRHENGVRMRLSLNQVQRLDQLLKDAGLDIQDLSDDLD